MKKKINLSRMPFLNFFIPCIKNPRIGMTKTRKDPNCMIIKKLFGLLANWVQKFTKFIKKLIFAAEDQS